MLDWIDPDNTPRENGAEDSENYHPPNRGRFVPLDEITQVKGSAPLTSLPNWRDDFTVNSPGPIDLQWASLAVLQVLPNVGDARAEQFLQDRRGADKTDYTRDDHHFANVAEALSFLGFAGPTRGGHSPLSSRSMTRRCTSPASATREKYIDKSRSLPGKWARNRTYFGGKNKAPPSIPPRFSQPRRARMASARKQW